MDDEDIRDLLCKAPDTQLDPSMHPYIREWSDPATPLQILEVLDRVVAGSLGSTFTVALLECLYESACGREGVTHDDVVKHAEWREKL